MAEEIVVRAPSGLVVRLAEWTVKHENIAASPETLREGKPKTRLLSAVTTELLEPGPYDFGAKTVDWEKVLHGDRECACRDNRVNTWGPDYFPNDPCPLCHEPYSDSFDLRKFEVKPLPPESLEHVRTGEPIEVELPARGVVARFRLWRGADEARLGKILQVKEEQRSTEVLKSHVLEIEGVSAADLPYVLGQEREDGSLGGPEVLPSSDTAFLREAIRQADCGIEQEGVWRCSKCGHRWTTDVNFGRDFFFPKFRGKIAFKTRSRSSPTSPVAPASQSPGGKT